MKQKLYQIIAQTVQAYHNCVKTNNTEWRDKHEEYLCKLADGCVASGSGIDSGTKIDIDRSTSDKLVLTTAFHHMDEYGGYAGWTEHTVIVTPSLTSGIDLRITGRNRNDVKEYLAQIFDQDLNTEHDHVELHNALMK